MMGIFISQRKFTPNDLIKTSQPTVICSGWKYYCKAINDAKVISLNLPLAKILYGKDETEIKTVITASILEILHDNSFVCLTDFEMLFNPQYKLDVLKLFCEISRHCKLIVKWCGSFNEDSLMYAEQRYADYSKYKVSDYEIVCVI